MKKIWLVYPYGNIEGEGGRDSRYTIFGKELSQNGFDVCWWTANFSHDEKLYRCNGWKKIEVSDNFNTILVPTSAYHKNISIKRIHFETSYKNNLKKAFYDNPEKPDLMVVASTGMFNAFEPCHSFAKAHNIPIIYDIMDIPLVVTYMQENYKAIAPIAKIVMMIERRLEVKFFKNISGITALGKNQLDYAIKRAFNRQIPAELVYNGNDVDDLRNRMKVGPKTLKVSKDKDWTWCVYSGSLGPQYDIETIISCARICQEKKYKIKFLIAGVGPQAKKVEEESEKNECINYIGFLNRDELAELYSLGDIGLIAIKAFSTCDMPDKFYDYCAAGLVILNTLQGEVKDYIDKYNLGLQYTPEDPNDLCEKIMKLIQGNMIEEYKNNAYNIGEKFDIKTQVEKLSKMAKTILKSE